MAEPQLQEVEDEFTLPPKKAEVPDFEIEIVDDTPPEDQGKAPIVEGVTPDPEEDEIAQYGEGVKKRIDKLTAEKHDQRRKKEAAERQLTEASNLMVGYQNELQKYREAAQRGEAVALHEASKRIESDLKEARASYKAAVEAGDTDLMTDAQEALATASAEKTHIQRVLPPDPAQAPAPQVQQPVQQQQVQQQGPPVDPKAFHWARRNPWFESDGNEDKTFTAYGIHYKMVSEGFDPRTDDYYVELDKRLKVTYPDIENGSASTAPAKRTAPQTVVAPANREPGSPIKVQLTASEVTLATRLGLSVQEYAREKMALARAEE